MWTLAAYTSSTAFRRHRLQGLSGGGRLRAALAADFFPDYKDTRCTSQRYFELGLDDANTLTIRNMHHSSGARTSGSTTRRALPGHLPDQFTVIDSSSCCCSALLLQHRRRARASSRSFKIPLGTWLPYFFEDSSQAYVVIPASTIGQIGRPETAPRTFSDFLQLVEDIIALSQYVVKLTATLRPTWPTCSTNWRSIPISCT